ncbi:transposase [Bacillus phage Saddex]|nr:transposase [Bacillus phage Saddex]
MTNMKFKDMIEQEINKGGVRVMTVIDMEKDVKKETLIQGAVTASWGSEDALTVELEEKVIRMYKNDEKVTSIQAKLDLSAGKIYRILRRNGVEKRRAPYKRESAQRMLELSDYEKKSIADMYIIGRPVLEIAKKFAINYQTVYDILDERAIVRRSEKGIAPNAKGKKAIGVVDEGYFPEPIVAKVDPKTAREVIDQLNAMKESGELRAQIVTEDPKVEPVVGTVLLKGKDLLVKVNVDKQEVDNIVVSYK